MAITLDRWAALILLVLAVPGAPARAQDVFNGNDGQQQGSDNGPAPGNNSYYLRHLPPVIFGPAPPGRQPPPPIDPNPCQPGGRGAYDWRNNPEGTAMPPECRDYIAAERKAGRSGMPARGGNASATRRRIPDGLTYGARPISPCQHNPNSQGCKSMTRQRDPDLAKERPSTNTASRTPDPPAAEILSALESCLASKLTYYRPPANRQQDSATVPWWNGSTLYFSPKVLSATPQAERLFRLERAVAGQVQDEHDRKFGVRTNDSDPHFRIDRIAGYLHRCLRDAALVPYTKNNSPDDPRLLYGKFVGARINSTQVSEFSSGYRETEWVPDSLESGR